MVVSASCDRPGGQPGNSTLTVQLPAAQVLENLKVGSSEGLRSASSNSGSNFGLSMPSTFSSLNCYYIFVGGPEASMSNNSCLVATGTNYSFGVLAGPVTAGTTASFQVPAGSNRTVFMGGYQSDSSTCPSLTNMQAAASHISPPVYLGSVAGLNMAAGASVSLSIPVTATLQPNNVFVSCSGAIGGGNGGNGNFGGHGSGTDGALTINSLFQTSQNIADGKPFNGMGRINSFNSQTSVTLWAGGGSNFLANQEVLVTLIAANAATGNYPDSVCGGGWYRGKYLFTHVQSVSSDTITFTDPITDGTTVNATALAVAGNSIVSTSTNYCDFRVVRVPNFSSLTINSPGALAPTGPMDPSSNSNTAGMFVVFRVAGTLTLNGTTQPLIMADGFGFGGPSLTSYGAAGFGVSGQGASGSGIASAGSSLGTPGGAGGSNAGISGTGYLSTTQSQANTWCQGQTSGSQVACTPDQKILAGASGGAGNAAYASSGGGIIMVFANTINALTSTVAPITANGAPLITGSNAGAGAGGSVLVVANKIYTPSNLTNFTSANGGSAGTTTQGFAGGGGSTATWYCIAPNTPYPMAAGGMGCTGGGTCGPGAPGAAVTSPANSSACMM